MLMALPLLLGAALPGAPPLSFTVTPSSPAHPITAMVFEVTAVSHAPAGADWLLLETVDGPHFSGLPAWFPLDPHSATASIKWWSEYFDRSDRGHDPVDPPHNSTGAPLGSFTVALSAWKGRNVTLLGRAPRTQTIHYDKTYTELQWNLTAAPRSLPGTVRVTLAPADTASEKLAPETADCWWFGYKYTGVSKGGVAMFAEEHTIDMRLPAPTLDLSLSLPGLYFVGIFGSFGTGVSQILFQLRGERAADASVSLSDLLVGHRCPKAHRKAETGSYRSARPLWPSTTPGPRQRSSLSPSSFRLQMERCPLFLLGLRASTP